MTRKQKLVADADGLGLSTKGTANEIEARINAYLEAESDTAAALTAAPTVEAKASKPSIHPMNALVLGAGLGAALHFIG